MALSQQYVSGATPPGASLAPGGAVFRVWAPRASALLLLGRLGGVTYGEQARNGALSQDGSGYWTGYAPGARVGDRYGFWVVGSGGSGFKRDPYARELADPDQFPRSSAILHDPNAYPWHDSAYQTPDFSDLMIYQAHIGTYAITKPGAASNFLDVAQKVPYLAALGVNLLQPLPVDEQEVNPSLGYGGADMFSPDFPYVAEEADLPAYVVSLNGLFAAIGLTPLTVDDLRSGPDQLKALVDLCHAYGVGVAFDVVYNHAGGFTVDNRLDANCVYYFDLVPDVGDNNDSLYFTDQDRGTGGLAFAMWNQDVCRFLLDNARYYVEAFHLDGFRYDEVSILLSTNQENGWQFCRDLTTMVRQLQPRLLQNAEFWPGEFADIPFTVAPVLAPAPEGGAGFDAVQHDALRDALRGAVAAASAGAAADVSMSAVASALWPPGLDQAWRAVTCIENHDLVMAGREPRIAALADPSNHRSWYARSRSRFASAVLITAPGIPQIFMGQEFLEDKPWSADPGGPDLIWWQGLDSGADQAMSDHLRFMQDVISLRGGQPALRRGDVNPYFVSDHDRVLAFHRWIEGVGQDVVIVATLSESTWWSYQLGFPGAGSWREVFNSDVYDHWVNPWVAGNGGAIEASGGPLHGFIASASIVIPANGVVVFAKG
jgi:1,4-alpha-glucan branching enzyme